MELLNKMLDSVTGNMMGMLAESGRSKKSEAQQAQDNETLRIRLQKMKDQNDGEMAKMMVKIVFFFVLFA